MTIKFDLPHPYARYGLAVALYQNQRRTHELNGLKLTEIASLLKETIETGLGHFRFATEDDPSVVELLRFERMRVDRLKEDVKLIQSTGLAARANILHHPL